MPGESKRRVLFVCTGNRARSQMAEGLLRHLAGDGFKAYSAGTDPKGLSPLAVTVMREIGIDISLQRSKSVEEFAGQRFDYAITVCDNARESCPVFPGGTRIHWSVQDPAAAEARGEAALDAFRAARDELRTRIRDFLRREAADSPARAMLKLPWRSRISLFWRLLRDARVPLGAKLLLPGLGLYLLSPLDIIPDFIPVVGYLDDLLVLLLGLWLFLRLCPRELFHEHLRRLMEEE